VKYSGVLEWIFAAKWAGYKWNDFLKLTGDDQSILVAAYQTERQIESVAADDQSKKSKASNIKKPSMSGARRR
jgi:hypothetical protein